MQCVSVASYIPFLYICEYQQYFTTNFEMGYLKNKLQAACQNEKQPETGTVCADLKE
jgi:hypothetical protein